MRLLLPLLILLTQSNYYTHISTTKRTQTLIFVVFCCHCKDRSIIQIILTMDLHDTTIQLLVILSNPHADVAVAIFEKGQQWLEDRMRFAKHSLLEQSKDASSRLNIGGAKLKSRNAVFSSSSSFSTKCFWKSSMRLISPDAAWKIAPLCISKHPGAPKLFQFPWFKTMENGIVIPI